MTDEYWGTFSIYDHRRSIYRQSLVVFDRIVIPVPSKPVGNLTEEEIERLAGEAAWLKERGAAEVVDWDSDEFKDWRDAKQGHGESMARVLVDDPAYATRLQLHESTKRRLKSTLPRGVESVTAVPVYGSRASYEGLVTDLEYLEERLMLDVILPEIPVPAPDSDLGDVLSLRDKPAFRASLRALRGWQRDTLKEALAGNHESEIRHAAEDFKQKVDDYREALADAKYKRVKTSVISLLAFGAALTQPLAGVIPLLAGVAPGLFSIRELAKPCWKDLKDMDCFPAGTVIQAEGLA